ncbi:MAG: zinc-dependent metalloprotease [Parvularculaceae bacterium]
MRILTPFIVALLIASCARGPEAESAAPSPNAASETKAATAKESSAPFFEAKADAAEGKVLVTLPPPDENGVMLRAIHTSGLTAGLGSNPVGLDRGFADEGRIIAFRKIGKKVIVEQENWKYRASAENPLEKQAVAESFARSFLWSGDIAEETANGVVVDLSGFLTTDILNLKGILSMGGQGSYSIAEDRSLPDFSSVLVFPDNVEMDAFLTFTGEKAGGEVAATAADGRTFTLTVHHSFVRLPEEGFKTRDFDARAAAIDLPFYDFSAPLNDKIIKRYARRFRLERVDASAAKGPVKKPIIFYVDRGAPEPIRSALVEGASWWAQAFDAAGFENAYRVELLPEGVHPMDARYNVIEWTHRQTRGWSYGGGVADPRTGEMLKAHVVLGSQRIRQDRMIFEGLAGTAKTGSGAADDPVELSLARIRQLSAHEVGHTLGFAHNFAASTNDRASVMDYPAPDVHAAADGSLDFSKAYARGMGAWDMVTVNWLYSQYPEGTDEKAVLNKIITDAYARGLRFVDDSQGRPVSASNPYSSVWDNGNDPIASLGETMQVRAIALANFGVRSLMKGAPTSDLRSMIVPVYLYHRYEIAAAAKFIGGYDFRYAVKGDGPFAASVVPAERQRAALTALVATLDPAALDLPDATLDQLAGDRLI